MSNQERAFDGRIGKHGVYPVGVCAGTGERVNGRHNTAIGLGDGYYCRVLNKWTGDRDTVRNDLKAVIAQHTSSGKRSRTSTKNEDQSHDE